LPPLEVAHAKTNTRPQCRVSGPHRPSVTRRDFVGSALLGTGAALLGMAAPGILRAATPAGARKSAGALLGPDWTGPGASPTTGARTATRTRS
jgi:hypothetical protein